MVRQRARRRPGPGSPPRGPAAGRDISTRERRISMTIRTLCFLGGSCSPGWFCWVLVAGAVLLLYVAVVMANAVGNMNPTRWSCGTLISVAASWEWATKTVRQLAERIFRFGLWRARISCRRGRVSPVSAWPWRRTTPPVVVSVALCLFPALTLLTRWTLVAGGPKRRVSDDVPAATPARRGAARGRRVGTALEQPQTGHTGAAKDVAGLRGTRESLGDFLAHAGSCARWCRWRTCRRSSAQPPMADIGRSGWRNVGSSMPWPARLPRIATTQRAARSASDAPARSVV